MSQAIGKVPAWAALVALGLSAWACAGQDDDPPPAVVVEEILEEGLRRTELPKNRTFAWVEESKEPKEARPPEASTPAGAGLMDLSGGSVRIRCFGPFKSEVGQVKRPGSDGRPKEILTLETDAQKFPEALVEIDQAASGTAQGQSLRGRTIRVVRDAETGNLETLEANGNVEIYTPARKGRGESLVFETRHDKQGRLLKNSVTVLGDKPKNAYATLWSGEDKIKGYRFELDLRLDTFRATAGAIAEIKLEAPPSAAKRPDGEAPGTPGMGMLPGLSLVGGKLELSCDGDLYYEGAAGRVDVTRNVQIRQRGLTMTADEMHILLQPADPAAAAGAGDQAGVFSGSLKTIDCQGRIEIVTDTQVVHCDKMLYDLKKERLQLQMSDPEEFIRIYSRDPGVPGAVHAVSVMMKKHRLDVDTSREMIVDIVEDVQTAAPPSPMRNKPFQGAVPDPRGLRK